MQLAEEEMGVVKAGNSSHVTSQKYSDKYWGREENEKNALNVSRMPMFLLAQLMLFSSNDVGI